MKERYVVATLSSDEPDFQAVIWFEKKEDAVREAQRQRDFYKLEKVFLLKVLNIPSSNADKGMSEGAPTQ